MKRNHIIILTLLSVSIILGSCSDWLDPKPLSFYTPENAFVDYQGLKTATVMLDRDLRYLEYYVPSTGVDPYIATELIFSDLAVNGRTDDVRSPQDLDRQITPEQNLASGTNMARCHGYWASLYKGIKDANTIIDRSEEVEFESEDQHNEILSLAYFHRAMRYYRLVCQFGDVPLILNEITSARYDFFSTKREVTLRRMKNDLDNTIAHLPARPNFGAVGQGAAYHLLTKINLMLCEFDDAIQSASNVIDSPEHSLMTTRFGVDAADPTKNVIWDLHRNDNKVSADNRETLYILIDIPGNSEFQSSAGLEVMRQVVPWFCPSGQIRTPDGKNGFADNDEVKNPYLLQYGRGICTVRSTWYHTNTIWEAPTDDYNDLRHDVESDNWVTMESLKYNNPDLQGTEWYGKNLKKKDPNLTNAENAAAGATIYGDTVRNWVDWPNYKINVPEQRANNWRGGCAHWYVFRLAETYLLRAEAYIWKGQADKAKEDINAVRTRAGARPLDESEVTIRAVVDERARELFYEEPRKTELTRIAYIYARTGQTADNGQTYTLADFSKKNFYFDHISATTDFYNTGAKGGSNTYTMSPHHVLWPIAQSVININLQGHINQNEGYAGAENNIEPIDHEN